MDESPIAVATPVRTGLRLLLPLGIVLLLLAIVVAAVIGTARWLLFTESGSLWLLGRLPVVEVKGYKGALLGEQWQADSVRVAWNGGQQWVLVEGLNALGLEWKFKPSEYAWVGLQVKSLAARRVTVHTGAGSGRPVTLPASIVSPVQLALAQARVEELIIDTLAPVHGIAMSGLAFESRPGAEHHIDAFTFEAAGLAIDGGLRLGTAAPLPLDGHAGVRPAGVGDTPRWGAVLHASGSVPQLQLDATLRGLPLAGREAPSLDVHAALRPMQPWKLAGLKLQTQALDLSALALQAPATMLSGHAELSGGDHGQPLVVALELSNALPGRWDRQRLPLAKLTAKASGSLARPDRLELRQFELVLADDKRPAGGWGGSAVWQGHELTLDTRLADVTPQRLDARAPAMVLSGPVSATLSGLPSPDFRGVDSTAATAPPPAPGIRWKLDLQGRVDNAPYPVQLQLEGSADDQRLDLRRVHAQAGSASADLSASVARAARGVWQLTTQGKLLGFDPLPWWPGEAASPWRKGPHKLSGEWRFDVRLPADADRLAPLALAQRLAGNGSLQIKDSLLAGVPLAAELQLGYAAPSAGTLHADLRVGGNQVVVDARGDPAGRGDNDSWRAEIKAEALAALAPLTRLLPALADWTPRQGSVTATLAAEGRWPALRTEGRAALEQFGIGKLALARGSANWVLDMRGQQPLSLQVDLAGLQFDKQRADHLRAELSGTLADHRIDISGALPLMPPPLAEQVLGIQAQSGTRAQMQARGAWRADPAGGGRWKAAIDTLTIGSWDGSRTDGPPASGWAEARDLHAELQFDGQGQIVNLHADPGRVRLADTVVLRWDEVRLALGGALPQLQLHADIEPFAVAPLLARAQPGMGWQGDLKLAARVDIRAGDKVDADLIFERRGGDLEIANGDATQLLGLTGLQLALAAHDGVWIFTQAFHGRILGDITGQVRVQSTPERRWPAPESPIEGQLVANVADIGIWSAWVPPGWRLRGEVRTTASIGGRFGAPEYTGSVAGTGLGVRNLLEGVNVSDGQIAVKLSGDSAQVERFTLKGGDGTLDVTGGATLGAKPQLKLQIAADKFKLLGRVDRTVITSGSAALVLDAESGRLDGKFTLDEALFDASRTNAPSLDDDVTVRRPGVAQATAPDPGSTRPRFNLALNLDVDAGSNTRFKGWGIDTGLIGQLHIGTPGGRLAITGTVNAKSGTYAAYGQKLEIDRGIVEFNGALGNPRLDVLALRPNLDTRVGVLIIGNLLSLRVRLYSEPEMSDTDKLAWLVLGRAPDGLGRNDTALLQRAAVALLSGEGEAPTQKIFKTLGVDDISLRQGDTDVRETVVSVGKQLSQRWYLAYERGVNAAGGNWQLTYRIAQRFTLRAQSGLDNALDVIWTWRLQPPPADAGMRKSSITPP